MISSPNNEDAQYQEHILKGVSRTFALTIPQLPAALRQVIGNAYLLCRITDTIEDDNALSIEQTHQLSNMFVDVVSGNIPAKKFTDELFPLLSDHTIPAEHELIKNAPSVIRVTHSFNPVQRQALERCISIMGKGMAAYQTKETLDGLDDLTALNQYCYYVAGVVGEMLTELFCDYSAEINQNKEILMKLAVSFGQGLQMTNILKDIWEDRRRGACWLPQDIFLKEGFKLSELRPDNSDIRFHKGLGELIGIAKKHLQNALAYTCLIPNNETGIRRFCLWALGMAIQTLNKINQNRDFTESNQVKITRRSVRATIITTSILAGNNWALNQLFTTFSRKLPNTHYKVDHEVISHRC